MFACLPLRTLSVLCFVFLLALLVRCSYFIQPQGPLPAVTPMFLPVLAQRAIPAQPHVKPMCARPPPPPPPLHPPLLCLYTFHACICPKPPPCPFPARSRQVRALTGSFSLPPSPPLLPLPPPLALLPPCPALSLSKQHHHHNCGCDHGCDEILCFFFCRAQWRVL